MVSISNEIKGLVSAVQQALGISGGPAVPSIGISASKSPFVTYKGATTSSFIYGISTYGGPDVAIKNNILRGAQSYFLEIYN